MSKPAKYLYFSIAISFGLISTGLAQSVPILTNGTVYSTDFHTATSSVAGSFTYTATSGTQVYTNTPATQWATETSGQNGWTNLTQQGGPQYGPGVIYHNSGNAYKANPYLNVLGGDSWFSTDINNSVTYPQSVTTYMAQSLAGTGTNMIHFDTTFWIYANAANNLGNYDALGWTLFNSAGNALISINLNTADAGSTFDLSASSYGNSGVTNQVLNKNNGTAIAGIANNQIVHLGFNIYGVGTTNETITVLNYTNISGTNLFTTGVGNYTVVGTNSIIGDDFTGIAGGTNIASFGTFWTLNDTNSQLYTNSGVVTTGYSDYADNSLLMSTLVVTVPEPKTWIHFGLSGLALVVYLRKRNA